ncbi:protein SSUH2 homolog [Hoplias malabaricus]|uniref:protein SSUH2 homolog n=1 Tax=Hoplias malabaricus TaxID=27720 RepID=UPI003462955D
MAYPPAPGMYPMAGMQGPPAMSVPGYPGPVPGPSVAYPVASMQGPSAFPGYEGLVPGANGGFIPPPPVQPMPTPDTQTAQDWSIPALTEEAARDAFKKYVDSNCCWSAGPANDGVITNTESFNTYRYRLETFTETRKTDWATKPYEGQPVNGFTQPPPGPWQIPVNPPEMFKNTVKDVEVPFTSSVKPCDKCSATGKCTCSACTGSGNKVCQSCSGSGKTSAEETCISCNGTGKIKCSDCTGKGLKECDSCKGKRQLLCYIKLTVEWKNNVEDFTGEQESGLSMEKLGEVSGKQLYKDTKYMVYPLLGFPNQSIVQASERMVKDHQSKYSQSARILQQQQSVQLIPITKVTYKWEGKSYAYHVYGNESKVKADDYPATCCCTIL